MEIFQSKLEEAEKTASSKEDCRRQRWRKPTYSNEARNREESRKSDQFQYDRNSRDRHSTTDLVNNSSKERFGDEKAGRRGPFGALGRRAPSPPPRQDFLSLKNAKSRFLRPSDDDEESSFHSKGRNSVPSTLSSVSRSQDPVRCSFRKPAENSEESSASWNECDRSRGDQKPSIRPVGAGPKGDQHLFSDRREETLGGHLSDNPEGSRRHCEEPPSARYLAVFFLSC